MQFCRALRTPEERVGMLAHASLPPPRTATPDDVLLQWALGARDEAALAAVLDLYHGPMQRVAMEHVRSAAAAEDVIQETWVAAIAAFPAFEGRSSVRTWLFRILRNVARARGREDARMTSFSELAAAGADEVSYGDAAADADVACTRPDPEQALLAAELATQIDAAIGTLPGTQRAVLVRRDLEGRNAADVCTELGISDGNQRVLLHRARHGVRRRLHGYMAE